MSELTIDKLKAVLRELEQIQRPSIFTVGGIGFGGIPIYETPLLVETEEYQEMEQLTLWQRWIEPISTFLNFQTMPFQPWVKTRKVTKTRQVPMRKVLQTQFGLFMHPILKKELSTIAGIIV